MSDVAERAASAALSDEAIRAIAVQELGLEGLQPPDQDTIMNIVHDAMRTRIETALLRALGMEGVRALSEVPEGDDTLFLKKMSSVLPDLSHIIKDAIAESVIQYRLSAERALKGL